MNLAERPSRRESFQLYQERYLCRFFLSFSGDPILSVRSKGYLCTCSQKFSRRRYVSNSCDQHFCERRQHFANADGNAMSTSSSRRCRRMKQSDHLATLLNNLRGSRRASFHGTRTMDRFPSTRHLSGFLCDAFELEF